MHQWTTEAQTCVSCSFSLLWPFWKRPFPSSNVYDLLVDDLNSGSVIWLKDEAETSCTCYLSNYIIYCIIIYNFIARSVHKDTYRVVVTYRTSKAIYAGSLSYKAAGVWSKPGKSAHVSPPFSNQCNFFPGLLYYYYYHFSYHKSGLFIFSV